MLRGRNGPVPGSKVRLENPAEELKQDLEADLCDGRVVAALAQLVPDEGVLRPGELVKAEDDARVAQLGADEVAPGVGHVGVLDAEDQGHLAAQLLEVVERVRGARGWRGGRVGGLVGAEGARVDVGGEVGDAGGDARVELRGCLLTSARLHLLALRAAGMRREEDMRGVVIRGGGEGKGGSYSGADGEVAAKTHARGADEAGTRREGEEVVDCGARVCVVRLEGL